MTEPREARPAPAGVLLAPRPSPTHTTVEPRVDAVGAPALPRSAYFERLLNGQDRAIFLALTGLWLLANYQFWSWWLQAEHIGTPPGFVLNTLLISVDLIEPAWFFFFVWRMRRPVLPVPPRLLGFRVAAATTKTPSEPLEVVGQTLLAIRAMEGEHDTWLLDEGGDPEVRRWCESHGIRYFSRKGIDAYQQSRWPFQSRMKAGNYNSWLDHVGFDRDYDVFCQFDSDHRPRASFLQQVLPVLARPEVAYVSAPSLCVGNRDDSWAVLGRAELETAFHGPLQTGFNDGYAPLIIGSHCTFRLSSLREIGGFQTTWCEDHDNTLAFNSMGYDGVFQMDAIAVGDGPSSFAEAMQQEYQWSRGLVQILLNSTPLWLSNLSLGKRMQFLFCQFWYPRLSVVMLGCVLLPGLALATNSVMADVSYPEFWFRQMLVGLPCLGVVHLLWLRGWTRPREISYFSWRTLLFLMARWPWILIGVAEATLGRLFRRDFSIKVTAKGKSGPRRLPFAVLWPYVAVVIFSTAVAVSIGTLAPRAGGYALVALITAAWYTGLVVSVVILHLRENPVEHSRRTTFSHHFRAVSAALVTAVAVLFGIGSYVEPLELIMPRTGWSGEAAAAARGPASTLAPAELTAERSGELAPDAGLADVSSPSTEVRGSAAALAPDAGVVDAALSLGSRRPTISVPPPFPPGRQTVGAYDPDGQLVSFQLDSELLFHFWRRNGADELVVDLDRVLRAGRAPIITLQPRPLGVAAFTPTTLLDDVAAGEYDLLIRGYAQMVRSRQPAPVVVRFAPEMELHQANPWAINKPSSYVVAYRRVVEMFRAEGASNVTWMWSPAGNSNAAPFYPGDEYVDLIGVTILASEAWDKHWGFEKTRSFTELVNEKYYWAELFRKPLVLAEVGVAISDPAEERDWLDDARASLDTFPLLRGFSYFNAKQPKDPPQINVFPDWRLRWPERLFEPKATPAPR